MIYTNDELRTMLDEFTANSENTLDDWLKHFIVVFAGQVQQKLQQANVMRGDQPAPLALTEARIRSIADFVRKFGSVVSNEELIQLLISEPKVVASGA